jgi:diguanylate cyclase (GGDEF)-like protein/PAS domain S-box-containing protein
MNDSDPSQRPLLPGGHPADPFALPTPWLLIDRQGRIARHNPAFAQALKVEGGAVLIGTPLRGLMPAASQLYFDIALLPALCAGQAISEVQLLLKCRDGPELPVLIYASEDQATGHFQLVVAPIPERRRMESSLISVRNAVEQAPGAIFTLEQSAFGRLRSIYFSGDAPQLPGLATGDVPLGVWKRMQRAARRQFVAELARAAREFHVFQFDIAVTGSGSDDTRWLHMQARSQLVSRGVRRWFGHIMDVTPLKRMERALGESHEFMRVTLESIGDAVITTDTAGQVRWFNPVAERMTGWSTTEVVGRPLTEVIQIVDAATQLPEPHGLLACLQGTAVRSDARDRLLISRDGAVYGIEPSAAPICSATGAVLGAVVILHDVSQQRELSRQAQHRASHDALTGLLNRGAFEQRLARLLASGTPETHVLLYIDLDQFKLVNDACGHNAGDLALREISRLLSDSVRTSDLVARIGGDEFGIVLEHCGLAQAAQLGTAICDRMDAYRFVHGGRPFRLGTSIGLVLIDGRWSEVSSLVQAADMACYAAKDSGRNRVHVWFDSDLSMRRRSGETQWAAQLEQAIADDRLELYAQRIQPARDKGAGLHCEILLRLHEPDGTLVLPGPFIAAAERFFMATRIDRWVLNRAIETLELESSSECAIDMVSINVSGQSISDPAFRHDAVERLRRSSFDVSKLCFEITETIAASNAADAARFVEQMHALGARIALDDFGAGSSYFGLLKTLTVDFLKIDGQFIRDLIDDPLDHVAVRCFQEVARTLGMRTVAECVEIESVRERLTELGIDFAQGFLIHRPEPFLSLLEASAPRVYRSRRARTHASAGMPPE